jgi:Sodium/hydrogen exchanger family
MEPGDRSRWQPSSVASAVLAFLPLVLVMFLPPLLYQEAFSFSPRDLRANACVIALLAVGLVLATTSAVAAVTQTRVSGLPWAAAFALGRSCLSPTDPWPRPPSPGCWACHGQLCLWQDSTEPRNLLFRRYLPIISSGRSSTVWAGRGWAGILFGAVWMGAVRTGGMTQRLLLSPAVAGLAKQAGSTQTKQHEADGQQRHRACRPGERQLASGRATGCRGGRAPDR